MLRLSGRSRTVALVYLRTQLILHCTIIIDRYTCAAYIVMCYQYSQATVSVETLSGAANMVIMT